MDVNKHDDDDDSKGNNDIDIDNNDNDDKLIETPRRYSWYDRICLFSPWMCYRIAEMKNINLKPILHSTIALIVGIPILSYYVNNDNNNKNSDNNKSIVNFNVLLSPWSLPVAFTYKASTTLMKLYTAVKEVLQTKSWIYSSALNCLNKRIQSKQGYSKLKYDVYFPPNNDQYCGNIIFLPGAYVDHTAYAEPASMIADSGYVTVVISAEPYRLVDTKLTITPNYIRKIQKDVIEYYQKECSNNNNIQHKEWYMIGHSMGSFACTKLVKELNIRKIALWGVAPLVSLMEDLSNSDMEVLVVQASNDIMIDTFATPEMIKQFDTLLPITTTKHIIQNGTHSGFASYVSNWKPEVNGIPRLQQQKEAVNITINFFR